MIRHQLFVRPGTAPGMHRPASANLAAACGLGLCLALATQAAHAQVFKWVGADGKVNYSDVPPPPTAQRAQKKAFAGNVVDGSDLPFSVAEAVKASPVTLYTGAKCLPCEEGRKLLNERGIPFVEKTVASNADIATLGNGAVDLPQLAVGSSKLRGFEPGAWNASLSAAGYPESNRLPKSYRNPAPQAAAPTPRDAATTSQADANATATAPVARPVRNPPKPPDTNPAGIRF